MGHVDINWPRSVHLSAETFVDNTLFYAVSGLAFADHKFNFSFPTTRNRTVIDSFSVTLSVWTLRAGSEIMLADRLTMRGEFRGAGYSSALGSIVDCCAPAPDRQDHRVTSHALRVGINRLF